MGSPLGTGRVPVPELIVEGQGDETAVRAGIKGKKTLGGLHRDPLPVRTAVLAHKQRAVVAGDGDNLIVPGDGLEKIGSLNGLLGLLSYRFKIQRRLATGQQRGRTRKSERDWNFAARIFHGVWHVMSPSLFLWKSD